MKQNALVAVTTVLMELKQNLKDHRLELGDSTWLGKLINPGSISSSSSMIGLIEIAWRGQVERICFPLPLEVKYLPSATKQAFLNEVFITSAEKRMSSLFKKSDFFISGKILIFIFLKIFIYHYCAGVFPWCFYLFSHLS
jgi:hypothetical protein